MYFGIVRDYTDKKEELIDLDGQSRLKDLHQILKNKWPQLDKLKSYRLAVNEHFAEDENIVLKEGDEIAIIPPGSGG
jgi:molybdopterin converting factor small subunit